MPRASRYLVEGYTFHLTHRCHDKRFLLRFSRERDLYREWLRIGAKRYAVPVLGYCLTSSHVHVVVHAADREAIGLMMGLAAGAVAKQLNERKGHEGSVWEHPYQCTLIQDGRHLLNCLRYVDLNMFRAGVVPHPSVWRWCGYDELAGRRKRHRILDVDQLLRCTGLGSAAELARLHTTRIEEAIRLAKREREPHWTEAVAIGDHEFVRRVATEFRNRQQFDIREVTVETQSPTWIIRETTKS